MRFLLLLCCLLFASSVVSRAQNSRSYVNEPVEKAKELQKRLQLSDDQTSKIIAIYRASFKKFDAIKAAANGNTIKILAAIGPLRSATIKKINAVLTRRQAVQYDQPEKVRHDTLMYAGWNDGWSSTSNASGS